MKHATQINLQGDTVLDRVDGDRVSIGNAGDPTFDDHRGWFIGTFWGPRAGLRSAEGIEVKWSKHAAGIGRREVSGGDLVTSLAILVSGVFRFSFPFETTSEVVLSSQGDYVIYGPGVRHTWRAIEDSVIMTVRWRPVSVSGHREG